MLETCLGLGIVKLFLAASAPYWLPHNNVFWIFVGHLLTDTKVRCRDNLLTNSEQPHSVQPQIVIHCHLKRLYRSLEDWKPFQSCLEFFLDIKTMQFLPRKWKKKPLDTIKKYVCMYIIYIVRGWLLVILIYIFSLFNELLKSLSLIICIRTLPRNDLLCF